MPSGTKFILYNKANIKPAYLCLLPLTIYGPAVASYKVVPSWSVGFGIGCNRNTEISTLEPCPVELLHIYLLLIFVIIFHYFIFNSYNYFYFAHSGRLIFLFLFFFPFIYFTFLPFYIYTYFYSYTFFFSQYFTPHCLLFFFLIYIMSNDGTPPPAPQQPAPFFPRYIPGDVELWLLQLEAIFPLAYSSEVKFRALVSLLPPEVLRVVKDVLPSVQVSPDPYTAFRTELLNRVATSREERIAQLLSCEALGARTPRQLMTHLLSQLGSPPSESETLLIRELFLKKLPLNAQGILAATSPTTPLQEIASIADRIFRTYHSSQVPISAATSAPSAVSLPLAPTFTPSTVASASTLPASGLAHDLHTRVACLESKVDSLQSSINSLIISITSSNRARSSTHSSRSGPSRGSPSPSRRRDSNMCYYHSAFGDRALKCTKPCSFQGNAPTSQ